MVTHRETELPSTEDFAIYESTEAGRRQAAATKHNARAMAHLTMTFTSESSIASDYEAMTPEWPSGLAHVVVTALKKKYQPQDTMTRVELRQHLNRVSMKKDEDSNTLFEQLSAIKNRYNTAT